MSTPYRICFVCLGNICRSPMAEVVARFLLEEMGLAGRVTVASAGTGDWHVGRPAQAGSVRALEARGYDGSRHRAQQLTADRLADYDLLIGLDPANLSDIHSLLSRSGAGHRPEAALLLDFAADAMTGLGVPDPYGMDAAAFEHALDLVERACRGLVDRLTDRFDPR